MKRTIALSLCLAFVASAAFAFPFGMPPKENPMITKVAPEDSGLFISWQGTGDADANSNNLVEQSLTKSEVSSTLKEMRENILEKLRAHPLLAEFTQLGMRNGACFYVSDKKASSFAGMVAVGVNDQHSVDKLTLAMKLLSKSQEISVSTINVGKLSFYKLSFSSGNDFYWGVLGKGKVIVFANSQKAITTILNNARTPEPEWVTTAKEEFNIERLSTLSAAFGNFLEESKNSNTDEDVDPAMKEFQKKFLGGEHIDRIVAASGLDSVGSVHKTAIYMKDGWKKTLPGILIDKSLSEKDLSVIPSNSVLAVAGKTDLGGLLKAVTQAEGLPEEMKMQIAMGSMVVTPYLAPLGDSWAFFITEDNGVPGGALVWSLKNPAMAKIQLKQLMEMLKNNMQKTEMQIEDMGMNNRELRVIPTQLKLFGDDEEEAEDDPMPGMKIQVIPGGQIPPGAIPGGALPNGAVPMGGGQIQLGGGNVDPSMLLDLLPESIEKIKIDGNDFWLLKKGEDNSSNFVIGIAGKNLIVTTKSYAEKYMKFDGTQNLGSNKSVVKMMSNNPSFLVYANQESVPDFIKGFIGGLFPSTADQYSSILDVVTDTKLPIVAGVYPKGDSIRIDFTSGLPIPDWMTMSFLYGFANSLSESQN